MSEVVLIVERLDVIKDMPAYQHEVKLTGNQFHRELEKYSAKLAKQQGGSDGVERGMNALTIIIEQQHLIRDLVNLEDERELMKVQAYQLELIEELKQIKHATISPATEAKVA